jgi:hypothetical protein
MRVLLPTVVLLLGGCATHMAGSGQEDPPLGLIRPGAERHVVEAEIGEPEESALLQNGDVLSTYEYETGDAASSERAAFHYFADRATLFLWEVVATPYEALQGDTHEVQILYSQDGRVKEVRWPDAGDP